MTSAKLDNTLTDVNTYISRKLLIVFVLIHRYYENYYLFFNNNKLIYLLQTLYKTDRLAPDYIITSILLTTFLTKKGTVSIQNKTCSFDLLIEK